MNKSSRAKRNWDRETEARYRSEESWERAWGRKSEDSLLGRRKCVKKEISRVSPHPNLMDDKSKRRDSRARMESNGRHGTRQREGGRQGM